MRSRFPITGGREKTTMKCLNWLVIPALATLSVWVGAPAVSAAEYHVDRQAKNEVIFVSDAPLDDFEGVTDRIDGYVILPEDSLTPAGKADGSRWHLEVDLADLDTGIGLRNRHMRENYLHTDRYPYAIYSGTGIRVITCAGDSCDARTAGSMDIHGVKKPMEISCTITTVPDGYRVTSAFTLLLPDFNIEVPSLMFMKISEEIKVRLDFTVKKVNEQ